MLAPITPETASVQFSCSRLTRKIIFPRENRFRRVNDSLPQQVAITNLKNASRSSWNRNSPNPSFSLQNYLFFSTNNKFQRNDCCDWAFLIWLRVNDAKHLKYAERSTFMEYTASFIAHRSKSCQSAETSAVDSKTIAHPCRKFIQKLLMCRSFIHLSMFPKVLSRLYRVRAGEKRSNLKYNPSAPPSISVFGKCKYARARTKHDRKSVTRVD